MTDSTFPSEETGRVKKLIPRKSQYRLNLRESNIWFLPYDLQARRNIWHTNAATTGLRELARKHFEEMVADGLRETGVLVFVFSILDRVIDGKITTNWTLVAMGVSALFFGSGLYIERRRPGE
jgi:hypothetical protein